MLLVLLVLLLVLLLVPAPAQEQQLLLVPLWSQPATLALLGPKFIVLNLIPKASYPRPH